MATANKQPPLNVALFITSPLAIPSLNALFQRQCLAGVILPSGEHPFLLQLAQWLQQQHIRYLLLETDSTSTLANTLRYWEADAAVCFGATSSFAEPVYQAVQHHFYTVMPCASAEYWGPCPLYWLLREGHQNTQLTVLKASLNGLPSSIVAQQQVGISPLDTLMTLENRIAQQLPTLLDAVLTNLDNLSMMPSLPVLQPSVHPAPIPQDADLMIDWSTMHSQQIVDLARAGNPTFSGCILRLGHTALNLLQATVAHHNTYGVTAGTICHTGEPEGMIVATIDGALRLDIIANVDGIFSGLNFAERFAVEAGMAFTNSP
jgi:methionyl-tRNA formyltransferase